MTLAMTFVGCLIGFGWPSCWSICARRRACWALPLRFICIAYVEVFRRIPFLVVIYLVLFFIQAFVSRRLAVHHRGHRDLHLRHRLYRRDHPGRARIGTATQVEAARR